MALSVFDEPKRSPTAAELRQTLGKSASLWEKLTASINKLHGPVEEVWNFSGAKYGWSVRLKRKDRVVLYLIPQKNGFLVGIVLGEKAVNVARTFGLPEAIIEMIDNARPYAEGRGIRLPVKTAADVKVIEKLVAAKLSK